MIKFLYAWRDNPNRTAAECDAHYRNVHMAMAKQVYTDAEGFVAIAYNRVKKHTVNDNNEPAAIERPSDIDAFVELWFEDRASLEKAFGHPVLAQMFDDHANFMDVEGPANIRVYEVDEDVFFGKRPN